MEKEEILLGVEMGRLEIEPIKLNKNKNNENTFINLLQKKNFFKSPILPKESKCTCSTQRKNKHFGIHKKKHNKILKEPMLHILKNCGNNSIISEAECQETPNKSISDIVRCDPLNLCTLVHDCNQLTISSTVNEQNLVVTDVSNETKWWKNEVSSSQEPREPKQQSSRSGTCSQQVLNPPCDVTIDELASYFETLVHIPKKMSSMAEMMYI